jgi:chaperone required for assembly of F1-ATPase
MKRFWQAATTVRSGPSGYAVMLDGRQIKTPQKHLLHVPTRKLAEAIAGEWDAQGEDFNLNAMPLTALAQGVIDVVAHDRARIAARISVYGDSDMLCYRADDRQEVLAQEQAQEWDPLLSWASARFDVAFIPVAGIIHQPQPAMTQRRLREVVAAYDDYVLAGMLSLVGLSGSLVLALALVEGHKDPGELWRLACLEEDWQAKQWGHDAEAQARRDARTRDWLDSANFIALARK